MNIICLLGRRLSTAPAKLSVSRVACSALLLLSGGCRMCAPGYDYCSPTNPHGDQSMCCDHGRRGSAFNADGGYYGDQVVGEEVVGEGVPNQAPTEAPAPEVEQNFQDAAPPAGNPPMNVEPAPAPAPRSAPVPRGPMTSRGRNTVMMNPSSRRTR